MLKNAQMLAHVYVYYKKNRSTLQYCKCNESKSDRA